MANQYPLQVLTGYSFAHLVSICQHYKVLSSSLFSLQQQSQLFWPGVAAMLPDHREEESNTFYGCLQDGTPDHFQYVQLYGYWYSYVQASGMYVRVPRMPLDLPQQLVKALPALSAVETGKLLTIQVAPSLLMTAWPCI